MDPRKSNPDQPQPQAASNHQQQQQQQLFRLVKRATKIMADSNTDQDQYMVKQRQPTDCSDQSTNNTFCGNNNNDMDMLTSNAVPTHNIHFINPTDVGNIPSSSYNIRSCSVSENATNLGLMASVPTTTAPNTTRAQVPSPGGQPTSANLNEHQQLQQAFTSPQILPYDIKSLFECPICFDYAVPPIYQCQNGHLVCQSCSGKITSCPTCRVSITEPSIRNLQLDRLANTFQFPCKFNSNGCRWKSYWFKKREHEENCDYISYSCPCPGSTCKWTGLLPQVMPHLTENHKSITTLNGEDIVFLATDINLKGAVDWVMIQSCFNHYFLLVLEKQESKSGQQQFFAIVQLIGSPKEAEKFRYRLELNSCTSDRTRRLQWEASPRSILDEIQLAMANYDCLVFDSRMAQHFLSPIKRDSTSNEANQDSNQGENLGINVTIERLG